MPLFSKSNSKPTDTVEPEATQPGGGKSTPTPKRSQQVAKNQRPLIPTDRKEAQRAARAKMAEQRDIARRGFERGDPRYLPERDKGEVRKYVRDYVDARISVATLMVPAMLVIIALTFTNNRELALTANFALFAFVGVAVLDCVIMSFLLRRRVTKKFGPGHTKGNGWYASMRAAQLPFMRLPKRQVKLFQFPE